MQTFHRVSKSAPLMLSNELTSSLFTVLTMTDYFLAASVFILEFFSSGCQTTAVKQWKHLEP